MKSQIIACLALTLTITNCEADSSNYRSRKSSAKQKKQTQLPQTNNQSNAQAGCFQIRGGELIPPDSPQELTYKSVGMIQFRTSDGGGLCTGTLISPNIVLTADHCVHNNQQPFRPDQMTFKLVGDVAPTRVKQVISWDQTPHRDAALLVLEAAYPEDLRYYTLKQAELAIPRGSLLTMVGYGAYTDGQNIDSFDFGDKRIGTAVFDDYILSNYFGDTVDNIYLLPNNNAQIICQGDSGSALFYDVGGRSIITGIASLGASEIPGNPAQPTDEQICHYAADALYVPTDTIFDWIEDKLLEVEPNYAGSARRSLLTATISDVSAGQGFSTISLDNVNMIDNGLEAEAINQIDICYSACPATRVNVNATIGKQVLIEAELTSDRRLIATKIQEANKAYVYETEFIGTVASTSPNAITLFGQKQRQLVLTDIQVPTDQYSVPKLNENVETILCEEGCSVQLNNSGVLRQGSRVKAKVKVINHEKVYLTGIEPVLTPQTSQVVNTNQCQ